MWAGPNPYRNANQQPQLTLSHIALTTEGVWWQGTGYICIVDKNDIGTTTLLENRENSQIPSFYLV